MQNIFGGDTLIFKPVSAVTCTVPDGVRLWDLTWGGCWCFIKRNSCNNNKKTRLVIHIDWNNTRTSKVLNFSARTYTLENKLIQFFMGRNSRQNGRYFSHSWVEHKRARSVSGAWDTRNRWRQRTKIAFPHYVCLTLHACLALAFARLKNTTKCSAG